MASVLSPPRTLPKPPRNASARRSGLWTWLAGLLFALPLIGLAIWVRRHGFVSYELLFLQHRARMVEAGGASLRGLRYAYPPLPVLLAMPFASQIALAVVTSLCSGGMLAYLGSRLHLRLSWPAAIVLVIPLVAVPAMWFAASQMLAQMIALSMLAVALEGFIRFAVYGQTEGGFVAGLALAVSYYADPGALLYAAVMCAFPPHISHIRFQDQKLATASIGAVLTFPIVAAAAAWSFLIWKFSGTFPGSLHYAPDATILAFPAGVLPGLGHAAVDGLISLAHAPLYLVAGVVLFALRQAASLALSLPVVALIGALWLGFDYSQIAAYLMFTVLALIVVMQSPARRDRRVLRILLIAAVAQALLAIYWPPTSLGFGSWVHALAS